MEGLAEKIENWFLERNILPNSSASKQWEKLEEELSELEQALADNNLVQIKDGIGDTVVVLTGLAMLKGTSLTECMQHAYDEIKDRTGKMVDGIYVKE
jgi:hypothetical protein